MQTRLKPLAALLALSASPAPAADIPTLDSIVVTATRAVPDPLMLLRLDDADIAARRATTSDSASLLRDIPGVSLYGAGGVSSLPAMHGLADDRLRIKVDGMDLIAA